ncbi:hypothetical protein [Acaryochloris sp. IP29b_bin.148]|uniref:hypothetical protein n=1 Tax=Acaryochloris sp. IP29b_bin.148 TaxID=2969218 RepID=UPI002628D9C9|nr:hypothetical protein [Acaryochloris sp. IP29b_bin.148]
MTTIITRTLPLQDPVYSLQSAAGDFAPRTDDGETAKAALVVLMLLGCWCGMHGLGIN